MHALHLGGNAGATGSGDPSVDADPDASHGRSDRPGPTRAVLSVSVHSDADGIFGEQAALLAKGTHRLMGALARQGGARARACLSTA